MDGSSVSSSKSFCHQDVDHIPIFSMHHREEVIFSADAHYFENAAIIQSEPTVVGGEDLHTSDTHLGEVQQLFRNLVVEMSDIHMKTVINAGFGVCHGTMPGNIFCQDDRLLGNEIDHGGRSAKGGCFSASVMIISRDGACHRQFEVHMGVHPTRKNQKTAGIHDSCFVVFNIFVNPADKLILHQDICFAGYLGGDYCSIFDERFHKNLTLFP